MRTARIKRETRETQIRCKVDLDGSGNFSIKTPIPFFTHMLEQFALNSGFDLELDVEGDIEVDNHHTIEDTGIVLGAAIREALGDMQNINRSGYYIIPMDESLAIFAIDICGRPYLKADLDSSSNEFFRAFANNLKASIHIKVEGRNIHHKIESIYKAFGKAMGMAASKGSVRFPSTKGLFD